MENQRQFLTIALFCIIGILSYKWIEFSADPQAPQVSQTQSDVPGLTEAVNSQDSSVPTINNDVQSAINGVAVPQEVQASVDLIEVETDLVKAFINPLGGVIERLELKDQPINLDNPELGYPLLRNTSKDFYVAQDGLLSTDKDRAPNHSTQYQSSKNNYQLGSAEKLSVPLTWTSADGVEITKIFEFSQDSYLVGVEYQVNNASSSDWSGLHYGQINRTQPEDTGGGFGRLPSYNGAVYHTQEEGYEELEFKDIAKNTLELPTSRTWAGMAELYFFGGWLSSSDKNIVFSGYNPLEAKYRIGYRSTIASKVAAGTTGTINSHVFLGPKEQSRLSALEDQGYDGLGLTVDYWYLTAIADLLFFLLSWIHGVVGNWGWSIILLTVLIKAVFYPLSAASGKSMAGMKKLQPRMKTLKERYPNPEDRQKFQTEMMALYKQEKINPAGGCLPILIQIPVFIALYWVLLESVEIRHAPFALWWQDLSSKDPTYLLPLLAGGSMFLMQKLNPTPMEDIQKKVMMILPVVLIILFINFPQGLVLYMVVNNILSMAQQWYINRKYAS